MELPGGLQAKNTLEAVALSDNGEVAVAVGQDGTVLVSEGHGNKWAFRERKTGNRLHGIALGAGSKVAMIVGHESTILRSEYADGQVFPKMEIVPVAGDTRERPALPTGEVPESRDLVGLFQSNTLRVGITVLFMFMAQHLFGLLRYKFRLAAFLDARRNAILLASMNMFPLPADAEELKQFMDSLSPDTLEIGRPSKTIMDRISSALVTRPCMINVDFEDVRAIMSERVRAAVGLGRGAGTDRTRLAVETAVRYPLLDGGASSEARGILVNVMAAPDLGMGEFAVIGDVISFLVSKDALVIVGTALDESAGDEIRVSVVATGIGEAKPFGAWAGNSAA